MLPEPHDWQLQYKDLKPRVAHLLQSGLWSDCSFLVGSEVVPGHKLMLSLASPVFEAMFYGTIAETNNQLIPVTDIQPKAFKALLEYIYTDKLNVSCVVNACGLYYGAKKYMLPHLMKKCLLYILSSLSPNNVCCVYEFTKVFEVHGLLKTCKQMIQVNASEVLKNSNFEEVELSTVLEVFSMERLRVSSELELFAAVDRRTRTLSEDGDQKIRNVLGKIRFLTLTPQQFVEGPAKSPLFTKDEVLSVLTNIVSSNSHLPLPDGFSACRVPRSLLAGSAEGMLNMEEDCWRRVLNYVPLRDIILSERVSRGWQKMVLVYLSSISIGILPSWALWRHVPDVRWLEVDSSSLELCCRKLGASLEVACCASEQDLKTIAEQCPNLKQDTEMEYDEARSEATFRYTVQKFRSLEGPVLSPPCYVRNLPWKIRVMPRQALDSDLLKRKTLGFFLKCNEKNESSSWSCNAMAELRLISHKPDCEPFFMKMEVLFCSKKNGWGFPDFMKWDDVLDPERGYIKDDAITVEVHVTAQAPHGVSLDWFRRAAS
ncbi:uncharacterized protein LOC134752142 [Cydia strobilella]|uniref:uncharacterized protein LOC134752142 n=1 Tax=Cydia strobilella TaxID=1100964 RepID=UPI0030070AE7